MPGFFSNNSPQWLLDKLRSDFESLATHPTDAGKAFNFFVTAESLLDWCAPDYTNKPLRKKLRDDDILLQTVSHIASNAKHFHAEAAHHNSVTETRKYSGLSSGGLFAGKLFQGKLFSKGGLMIELTGSAQAKFGSSITALDLAAKTLERCTELVKEFNGTE